MRPRNARAPRDVARRGAEPVLLMELQTAHCAGPALIQGGTVHGSSDVLLKPSPEAWMFVRPSLPLRPSSH